VIRRHSRDLKWQAVVLISALSTVASMMVLDSARAQGFFDFLFGGFQQRPIPPAELNHPPPPAGVGRLAPAPLGQESVNEGGGSTGHSVAFCVRLCDGHHFPLEQMVNGTPGETCRAICPYSKTKVFFGSEIGGAVAQDGDHYANLDAAFVYRKQLVANCTCNGRDAFGLASFDVKNDPTLRPGDIVSTRDGLMAYAGKSGRGAIFTSVNPAALPVDIRPASPSVASSEHGPVADDDPGTIMQPTKRQPQNASPR
jgi:hypothetical protein